MGCVLGFVEFRGIFIPALVVEDARGNAGRHSAGVEDVGVHRGVHLRQSREHSEPQAELGHAVREDGDKDYGRHAIFPLFRAAGCVNIRQITNLCVGHVHDDIERYGGDGCKES